MLARARTYYILLTGVILTALFLCGCGQDEPMDLEIVKMPVSISLPVNDVYAPQNAPEMRAFGDPGTSELFALPQYIYFFIVKQNPDESWEVWDVKTKSVADEPGATTEAKYKAWSEKWDTITYNGVYASKGDNVLQFNEELVLIMPATRFNGRVYAIASSLDLTLFFKQTIVKKNTLDQLLSLQINFDTSTGSEEKKAAAPQVRNNLQNIYSSPYNYEYNGKYYGSFSKDAKVPHVDLLLYHVASKVDLMWNVAENKRADIKISYIAAEHLYDGDCYLFKPTENEVAAEVYASGYTKEVLTSLSPGTQWNGRAYFYAIPYNNNDVDDESGDPDPHYPLKLRLQKNGDASDGASYYSETVKTDVPEVWTSWIRGQITINNDYNVK